MVIQFAVINSVTDMEGWTLGLGNCIVAGLAAPINAGGAQDYLKCLEDDVIVADDMG